MIPQARVFRIRYSGCSDGRDSRISVFDCSTKAIHYIAHCGETISMPLVLRFLEDMGLVAVSQFEYKFDTFIITQPN